MVRLETNPQWLLLNHIIFGCQITTPTSQSIQRAQKRAKQQNQHKTANTLTTIALRITIFHSNNLDHSDFCSLFGESGAFWFGVSF
jgi:hypothetical protein